jgi:hypothetical protein
MTMTLADILSIIAVVISIGAVLFTAYEQYWKKPQLSVVLGDSISLHYGYQGIALWACVVIVNQGAEDAVILRIDGTLTRDKWVSEIGWLGFGKYKDQAPAGKPFDPVFTFIDWAEALISPSRKASSRWIVFSGESHGELTKGKYDLELNVVTQAKRRRPTSPQLRGRTRSQTACSWTGSFVITEEGASELEKDLVGGAPNRKVPADTYSAHLTGDTTKSPSPSPTATLGGIPRP